MLETTKNEKAPFEGAFVYVVEFNLQRKQKIPLWVPKEKEKIFACL
jgi:uncharacterized protein YpmB